MAEIEKYINRISSEYFGKPRFKAWLTTILEHINPAQVASEQVVPLLDVSTAEGHQLDVIGEIVGIRRSVNGQFISTESAEFDDEAYRRLITAKIVSNRWNGCQGAIDEIWKEALSGDLQVIYHDNQDMSVTVDLIGDYRPLDVELVLRGYIVPKPMGVSFIANMLSEAEAITSMKLQTSFIGSVSNVVFPAAT